MKKLKAAMLVSLSVMMIAGAQSAFAATGVYDGPATARASTAGSVFTGNIDSSSDSDWFVVDNTGTSTLTVYPVLVCPSGVNLDVDVIWVQKSGNVSRDEYNSAGAGGVEGSSNIGWGISPGDTIYFRVHPHSSTDYSSSKSYTFIL